MIHLGLKTLSYHIRFDRSCHHPISFSETVNTRILFGMSFGRFRNYSISIGWRPNEQYQDKIDLFSMTYYRGVKSISYAGTINVDSDYDFVIENHPKYNFYAIEVYRMGANNLAERICKFSNHYSYPRFRMGITVKSFSGYNILMERN